MAWPRNRARAVPKFIIAVSAFMKISRLSFKVVHRKYNPHIQGSISHLSEVSRALG
jgi:hypothetical protein